jgi:hypothetical protein
MGGIDKDRQKNTKIKQTGTNGSMMTPRYTYISIYKLMDGWMNGWMDGWMSGWMDGWLVGWIHR